MNRPEIPQDSLLDTFRRRDRETVLSFLSLSSRRAQSIDEVADSLYLSLKLKHAMRDAPN
jgi:hypothetical protein